MIRLQVGKFYRLADQGYIHVDQNTLRKDPPYHQFRCTSDTGEVLFYSERGICAHDTDSPNPRHSVIGEIHPQEELEVRRRKPKNTPLANWNKAA